MGKNQRHKKHLKAEKAKVKLRVKSEKTKFLPRGANVTNTAFKIKPIVVQEQLKAKTDSEPLSKRKLNVKELLQRLKHYNVNVKRDSCIELRQIIAAYPEEILLKWSSQLLHDVCPLVLDKDSSVRRESVKLLNVILENMNAESLRPYFNILSSYVRCAMTDIDVSVQEDSLLFIDVLLKRALGCIAEDFEKILSNFIALLSKFRSNSSQRTITIHLSAKQDSINWRIKVLTRLNNILDAKFSLAKDDHDEGIERVSKIIHIGEINSFPLYSKANFMQRCPINFFGEHKYMLASDENSDMKNYYETLVPLLYETWLEVLPEEKKVNTSEEGTVLNEEAASVLRCITKTLGLLTDYFKEKKNTLINLRDMSKFLACLLKYFPYTQKEGSRSSKSSVKAALNNDLKCVNENLLISRILITCKFNINNKLQIEWAENVLKYMKRCLVNRNYVDEQNSKPLLVILESILRYNYENWEKKGLKVVELLEDVIHFHSNNYGSFSTKSAVFKLLCSLVNKPSINSSTKYQIWLSTLPSVLCNAEVSEETVDKLSMIARQTNTLFNNSLLKKLNVILDNLSTIKITGCKSDERVAMMKILSLFYFIPVLHQEHLEGIKNFLQKNSDPFLTQSMKDILTLRCETKETDYSKQIIQSFICEL